MTKGISDKVMTRLRARLSLRAPGWYERGPRPVTTQAEGWLPALRHLLAFALPRPCLACAARSAAGPLGLCFRCRSDLRISDWGRCRSCGRNAPALAGHRNRVCGECLHWPPPIERLFFLYLYRPPFDAVIGGLKYRGLEYLARPLADEIFDRFADQLARYDLLVPIPMHPWRRLRRGFNQAEILADRLAKRLGKRRRNLLRHRHGRPQSILGLDQRAANARRLLRLEGRVWLDGQSALLVDDVTTTGATLHSAARLLASAGASSLGAVVAARTPTPDE